MNSKAIISKATFPIVKDFLKEIEKYHTAKSSDTRGKAKRNSHKYLGTMTAAAAREAMKLQKELLDTITPL